VNAQADCAGCHSSPMYAPGGDPHLGQPEQINVSSYLAGGGDLFGPFVPRDLTPNSSGRPAGLTLEARHVHHGVCSRSSVPDAPMPRCPDDPMDRWTDVSARRRT
jgi:hypothetical protein